MVRLIHVPHRHLMAAPVVLALLAVDLGGAGPALGRAEDDHRPDRPLLEAVRAGVVLNPSTPVVALEEVAGDVDYVLVMSVNPGFGGQDFIPETLGKIRQVRGEIGKRGLKCEVEVDGGINLETAPLVVEAGADVLVAGSTVYGTKDGVAAAIRKIHEAIAQAREPRQKPAEA